jgi:hypothetical protein
MRSVYNSRHFFSKLCGAICCCLLFNSCTKDEIPESDFTGPIGKLKKIKETTYQNGSVAFMRTSLINYNADGKVSNIAEYDEEAKLLSRTSFVYSPRQIIMTKYASNNQLDIIFTFFINSRNLADSAIYRRYLGVDPADTSYNTRTKIIFDAQGIPLRFRHYSYYNDNIISFDGSSVCTIENKKIIKVEGQYPNGVWSGSNHTMEYVAGITNNLPGFTPVSELQWMLDETRPAGTNLLKSLWYQGGTAPKEKQEEYSYEFDDQNRLSVCTLDELNIGGVGNGYKLISNYSYY